MEGSWLKPAAVLDAVLGPALVSMPNISAKVVPVGRRAHRKLRALTFNVIRRSNRDNWKLQALWEL